LNLRGCPIIRQPHIFYVKWIQRYLSFLISAQST
jgi:hypothetical protein